MHSDITVVLHTSTEGNIIMLPSTMKYNNRRKNIITKCYDFLQVWRP